MPHWISVVRWVHILAAHMVLLTRISLDPRELAAHLGIAPYQFNSGDSVYRQTQSRHYGPPLPRKLLYLAARSVRTHNPMFGEYFLRKTAQGKVSRLVFNNIENRLVRIICAVLRDQRPFIPGFHSIAP